MKEELIDSLNNMQITLAQITKSLESDSKPELKGHLYEFNENLGQMIDAVIKYSNSL